MPAEYDNCERCGVRKSIYTEVIKGLDVCKKCKKEIEKFTIPDSIKQRDKEYKRALRRSKLCV